jgi:flagellar hook-length control protein FliK
VLRQGGGALTMKLSPASLGEVRIEMSMQGGRVSLQFDVGNIAAYEAIKGQLGELKHSLEQRGMTVERVETHVSPALARSQQAENQSNQRSGEQPGQNEQQRQDAADGQSRGRADGGDRESHGSGWESPDAESQEIDFEQSLRLGLDAVA